MKKLTTEQKDSAIWFFTKGGLYLPEHTLARIKQWLNENTEEEQECRHDVWVHSADGVYECPRCGKTE